MPRAGNFRQLGIKYELTKLAVHNITLTNCYCQPNLAIYFSQISYPGMFPRHTEYKLCTLSI